MLGESDSNTRFAETRKLLDYGFINFEPYIANTKGEIIGSLKVAKGLTTRVNVMFKDDVNLLVRRGEKPKVTKEVILLEDIEAPISVNESLGEVVYSVDGNVIGKGTLVAENGVERATFVKLLFRMIVDWFGVGRKQ